MELDAATLNFVLNVAVTLLPMAVGGFVLGRLVGWVMWRKRNSVSKQ